MSEEINKKNDCFPKKETDAISLYRLLVYPIGPNEIRRELQYEPLIIKSLTMIEPVTGRFKILQYNDKHAATTTNLVEKAWLCGYQSPKIIMYDHRNEFLGHEFRFISFKMCTTIILSV